MIPRLHRPVAEVDFAMMTRHTTPTGGVEDLDNADCSRVLGIIDRFRELGINEDISLPQVSPPDVAVPQR